MSLIRNNEEKEIENFIGINKKNISLAILDNSGVILIDTTKRWNNNKSFSNIQIIKYKKSSRYLIVADYQLVYSKAQVIQILNGYKTENTQLGDLCRNMGILEDDYIVKNYTNARGIITSYVYINKPKVILQKRRTVKFDCSDYVIIQ